MRLRTRHVAIGLLALAAAAHADSLWRPAEGPAFSWFSDTKARRAGWTAWRSRVQPWTYIRLPRASAAVRAPSVSPTFRHRP